MPSSLSPDVIGLQKAFDGARLKVERSIRHINELKAIIENLTVDTDNLVALSSNANGMYVIDIDSLGDQGRQIPVVIGDVLHNLRSALDHVWTAFDRAATGKASTFATFPFDETRQNLKTRIENSEVQKAFPEVKNLILNHIKTHSTDGGNHVLWSLTKLNKLDKHNILIPTIEVHKVGFLWFRLGLGEMTLTDCEFSEVSHLVGSDFPPEFYCKGKITTKPVFPEGLPVAGDNVLKTLDYLSHATSEAIDLFRNEFI